LRKAAVIADFVDEGFALMRRLADISPQRLAVPVVLALLAVSPASSQVERPIAPFVTYPKGPPSFFVTSRGMDGGNLGGLAGADAHCTKLAAAVGLKAREWRAYLSTQASDSTPAINARDRIGPGPWFNIERIRVAADLAHLHGDTLPLARAGNLISQATALTEQGARIRGKNEADMQHDILTGSTADGRAFRDRYDRTCRNWTYAGPRGSAQIGHSDRDSVGLSISWNSAHQTTGCQSSDLKKTGGAGLFYCFATHVPPELR
jgi:hypothetical protein